MDLRFTRPNPEEEVKKIRNKIKKMFRKKAEEANIDVTKLDSITYRKETFYNPYKYDNFNKFVASTQH